MPVAALRGLLAEVLAATPALDGVSPHVAAVMWGDRVAALVAAVTAVTARAPEPFAGELRGALGAFGCNLGA